MRLKDHLLQDWRANSGNNKGRLLLLMFRAAQWGDRAGGLTRLLFLPVIIFYKLASQFAFGCDFPLSMHLGPDARILHVHGIVINKSAWIGAGVTLRNGVTIGVKGSGIPGVARIGDNVEIGAGAILIGAITIGDGAKIGAGAVVVKDVPPGHVAVGNPARLLAPRASATDT